MGDRLEGVIGSFSEKNGYGFIKCEEVKAQYGNDVFLPQRELGHCRIGDQVTFVLQINKSGKPQASAVQSINGSAMGQAAADAGNMRLPGVVKKIDSSSGCGFIECSEVTETYGHDVFVAAQDMGSFQLGDKVSFVFFENQHGKPQGKELMSPDARANGRGEQRPVAEQGDAAAGYQGVIKSFSTKTGYGFIECAEATQLYGSDVFLVARDANGLKVGDVVGFEMALNNTNKPQASNVILLQDGGGDKVCIRSDGKGDKGKSDGKGKASSSDQYTGLRCTGVIKSYAEKSGYGFISCPECTAQYGCDAFLMAADLGSFGVGDHVDFDLVINIKGKPQGRNLASAGGSGGSNGSFSGCKGKDNGGGMACAGKGAGCWGGMDGPWGGMDSCWDGMNGFPCGGKDGWWGGDAGFIMVPCGKGPCGWGWGAMDGFGWGGMGACKGKDGMCWGGKDGVAWGMDGSCKGKGEGFGGMCGKDAMCGKGDKGGKGPGKGDGPPVKKARIEYQFESGGERYIGVVKSYTPSTGYGFIECAEVKQRYGFDTYYKGVQLGGAGVGDKVSFSVKLTPDGKPQADAVKPE